MVLKNGKSGEEKQPEPAAPKPPPPASASANADYVVLVGESLTVKVGSVYAGKVEIPLDGYEVVWAYGPTGDCIESSSQGDEMTVKGIKAMAPGQPMIPLTLTLIPAHPDQPRITATRLLEVLTEYPPATRVEIAY